MVLKCIEHVMSAYHEWKLARTCKKCTLPHRLLDRVCTKYMRDYLHEVIKTHKEELKGGYPHLALKGRIHWFQFERVKLQDDLVRAAKEFKKAHEKETNRL